MRLSQAYPRATVAQGTMSQEQFKLFQGVSPETAELFGELMGLESEGTGAGDQAFQQWLKAQADFSAAGLRTLPGREACAEPH